GSVLGDEPDLLDAHERLALVQDPHDDLFAEDGRDGADAEVDLLALDLELDAPVLREPPLGAVHLRHDLDPGDDGRVDVRGRRHDDVQGAVDAVPDPDPGLLRLDVDVAGPLAKRLHDDHVDQADDRGIVDELPEGVEP